MLVCDRIKAVSDPVTFGGTGGKTTFSAGVDCKVYIFKVGPLGVPHVSTLKTC